MAKLQLCKIYGCVSKVNSLSIRVQKLKCNGSNTVSVSNSFSRKSAKIQGIYDTFHALARCLIDHFSAVLHARRFDGFLVHVFMLPVQALKVARWHKAKLNFTGPVQVTHLQAKYKPVGTR